MVLKRDRRPPILLGGTLFRVTAWIHQRPGKGHDRTLATASFAGVADGATPLDPTWPDPGAFAHFALDALGRAALGVRPLREVWARALSDVAAKETAPQPQVSCSVAIVRGLGHDLEVSVLGDCTAVVLTTDARHVLHDPAVQVLDADAWTSSDKASALLRHREMMNTSSGYWIFSKDVAAADHVLSLTVPAREVTDVLLHTDGLARVTGPMDDRSIGDLISSLIAAPEGALADDIACMWLQGGIGGRES